MVKKKAVKQRQRQGKTEIESNMENRWMSKPKSKSNVLSL